MGIEDEVTEMSEYEFYTSLNDIGSLTTHINSSSEIKKEVKTKEFNLGEILDLDKSVTNNSKFTKKFIFHNSGDIPVYGASKYVDIPSYGYVKDNLESIKYFENCLTWNIDGSIGCFYREGRFSLSEKVIPLYLKPEYQNKINLDYLSFKMIEKAYELGFSRFYKPNQTNLKNMYIEFPINDKGDFDVEKQTECANRYKVINKEKTAAIELLKRIENAQIKVDF